MVPGRTARLIGQRVGCSCQEWSLTVLLMGVELVRGIQQKQITTPKGKILFTEDYKQRKAIFYAKI